MCHRGDNCILSGKKAGNSIKEITPQLPSLPPAQTGPSLLFLPTVFLLRNIQCGVGRVWGVWFYTPGRTWKETMITDIKRQTLESYCAAVADVCRDTARAMEPRDGILVKMEHCAGSGHTCEEQPHATEAGSHHLL